MQYAGLVFFVFSFIWLLLGIIVFVQNNKLNKFGIEVEARIISMFSDKQSRCQKNEATVAYRVNNTEYRKVVSVNRLKAPVEVGNTITIGYDPADPERAFTHNNTGSKPLILSAIVFGAIGIFTTIATGF